MADLATDPATLAWRRALGFEDQSSEADAARQTAQVQQRVAFQAPEIQYQGGLAAANISGGYEDRGLFRSGEHERGLAEQQHATQYQLGALELGVAEDIGGIQSALAQQIAARRRQQIEQELLLGQQLEYQQAQRSLV